MPTEPIEWFDIPSVLGRRAASILGLSKVPIVRLDESHRPLILAHLLALDETDRRLRFSYALGDAAIARYTASIDFDEDALFGIFGRDEVLLGVVHLASLKQDSGIRVAKGAELGLSLNADMRGHGLGTLLFQRALKRARNDGVEMLFVYTLMDNEAMLKIARKLHMEVSTADGQCEAHLRIRPASTTSVVGEFVDEQLAELDHLFKGSLMQVRKWAEEL